METIHADIPLPGAHLIRQGLSALGVKFTEKKGFFTSSFSVFADESNRAQVESVLQHAQDENTSLDAW